VQRFSRDGFRRRIFFYAYRGPAAPTGPDVSPVLNRGFVQDSPIMSSLELGSSLGRFGSYLRRHFLDEKVVSYGQVAIRLSFSLRCRL